MVRIISRRFFYKSKKVYMRFYFCIVLLTCLVGVGVVVLHGEENIKVRLYGKEEIERLLKELPRVQDDIARADILNKLSMEYSANDILKTKEYAKLGMELSRKLNYKKGICNAYINYAAINYQEGNLIFGLDNCNKAMKLADELGYEPGMALIYTYFGLIWSNQGEFQKSLEAFFKSLKIAQKVGDNYLISRCYVNIGNVYQSQGDISKGLEYSIKGLDASKLAGNRRGESVSYMNIGNMYHEQGNFDLALEYLYKNLKMNEELDWKKGITDSLMSIGDLHANHGNYDEALIYYMRGLSLTEKSGFKLSSAVFSLNIGDLFLSKKEYSKAFEYFLKSKKIFETENNKQNYSVAILKIAAIYLYERKFELTLKTIDTGLKILEEIKDQRYIFDYYLLLGQVYHEMGESRRSLKYLEKVFDHASRNNMVLMLNQSAEKLSDVYSSMGNYQEAYRYLKVFKEKSDKLKSDENIKKTTQLEMVYNFDKKQKQQEVEQKKKDLQQETEIQRQRFLKYAAYGIGLFLVIVFYTRLRLKIKVNRKLNKEIEDRKLAEAELMKSIKMETVGILSAGIAHDFNNLLTIISLNLEMIEESVLQKEPIPVSVLEGAKNATTQAADLVKSFITISEGGWITKTETHFENILKYTIREIPELSNIPLTISIDDDVKSVSADERQLRKVAMCILMNAVDVASNPGVEKKIDIVAQNCSLKGENLWGLPQGEYVYLSISDNGKGIPPENLDKIFDPYFSTKQRGTQKGMGMGLAVSYSIIKRHNGHIAISSTPGKGTTVEIFIPAHN